MKRKKRLCVIIKGPDNGVSLYRGVGPFNLLSRTVDDWEIRYSDTIPQPTWDFLIQYDAFFIQRPTKKGAKVFIDACHQMGKPVWLDYDDNMLEIPFGNPAHPYHSSESQHREFLDVLSAGDIVTVSTPLLHKIYSPHNPNCVVIQNAFMSNCILWSRAEDKPEKANLVWRGTKTHEHDINTHLDGLIWALEKNPVWKANFVGEASMTAFEKLRQFPGRAKFMGPFDLMTYLQFMNHLQGGIAIIPLVDDRFNRCKSNIAAIEAFYAGMPVIAPKFPEFEIPGVLHYSNDQEGDEANLPTFGQAIDWLMNKPEARQELRELGWNHVQKNLDIKQINELRVEVLKKLVR